MDLCDSINDYREEGEEGTKKSFLAELAGWLVAQFMEIKNHRGESGLWVGSQEEGGEEEFR